MSDSKIDRDLIRGGHYAQRPPVPHSKAEHMAAPTNAANVKKALANSAPSTHGGKAVAPCYVFLANDEASYISGQVLHPNGGNVIGS